MKIKKEIVKNYGYVFDFVYDNEIIVFCRHIKSIKGYNSLKFIEKKWRFNDIDIMYLLLKEYPQIEVHFNMQEDIELFDLEKKKEKIQLKKNEKLKEATDSKIKVKGIKGELYDYQRAAVSWLMNNNGRGLLSLDLGLGKTFVSLAYAVHTKKKKTLVICPVSMKYSWLDETGLWTNKKAMVIDSKSDLTLEDFNNHDIFIINYDILKKFLVFLTNVKFDCLIIDESTYCKNPSSIRAKAVKKISEKIDSVILLSGSPLLNRVIELYTSLNILDSKNWNNYYDFAYKYAAAHPSKWGGLDVSGFSNLPELKKRIDPLILRKKKEDVLKELPEKRFIDVPIKLSSEFQQKYNMVENSFIEYLKEIKNKSRKEINKSLLAEQLVRLNEMRQLTSEGKIDSVKDLIQNVLNSGEKMLVFGNFNKPLSALKEVFEKESVIITGSVSSLDRKKAIDEFQNNPEKRIFFGGMKSAGMGITLTAASTVIFQDFDWTPEIMKQCFSRADRIGQKASSISIYQMVALNTIDQKMSKILKKKQEIIDTLIDGKNVETKNNNMFKDIINSYE